MKKLILAVLVAAAIPIATKAVPAPLAVFVTTPVAAGVPMPEMAGYWVNDDGNTRWIPEVVVWYDNSLRSWEIHAYGACTPSYCDWGIVGLQAINNQNYRVTYDLSRGGGRNVKTLELFFNNDQLMITLVNNGNYNGAVREVFHRMQTTLNAPVQLRPICGSTLSNYPRTTFLQWQGVEGAVSYTVEVDCYQCCTLNGWCSDVGKSWMLVPNVRGSSYSFGFVGAQPGRWRVWAVGSDGAAGVKSDWCNFTYTQ